MGIEAGHLINEVIQSGSQVLDNFSNEPSGSCRCRKIKGEGGPADWYLPYLASKIAKPKLILQGNILAHNLGESFNLRPEHIQVFTCPINLFASAIERVHELYYSHEQETSNTENSQRLRDTNSRQGRRIQGAEEGGRAYGERLRDSQPPGEGLAQTKLSPSPDSSIAKHTHSGSLEDA